MKIAVINGPNLNLLGVREPEIYGNKGYKELCREIKKYGKEKKIKITTYQSNHEGALVDFIQSLLGKCDGIVINPGAYTHTSVALLDALKAVNIKTVEVHISEVSEREDFRQISYIRNFALKTIMGKGTKGYMEAIDFLCGENK
jgi:3-dehydroquinate dehydratase-2